MQFAKEQWVNEKFEAIKQIGKTSKINLLYTKKVQEAARLYKSEIHGVLFDQEEHIIIDKQKMRET